MNTKLKILFFCLICIILLALDHYTKTVAKEHLQDKEPISYFNNTMYLVYAENTGSFLSFGADWPESVSFWVFGIIPVLFLLLLFVYCLRKARTLTFSRLLPLCLIFAGGMGNIIDRLIYHRHVIDFMNVGIGSLRTGIFNVADLCITTGVVILFFQNLKMRKKVEEVA